MSNDVVEYKFTRICMRGLVSRKERLFTAEADFLVI